MSAFGSLRSIVPRRIWEGALARTVDGERVTVALVELAPGAAVPEHHHHHEQVGFVIQGSLTFTVGGETARLGPGDTYRIPSAIPHRAVAGEEGAVVADVFAPAREDWRSLETAPVTSPRWPPS
ncbi:MAG TPA: cupin domain-containing protein [Candidatus Dormibacteraeota bacterium]|nr:cupin domain-containing protein [Candidatus Dormibacteraeota bacterium]